MNAEKLFVALRAVGKTVDIKTTDGRTYQMSGDRRMAGMYERVYHADQHPTRRNVGNAEMQVALDQASEIWLWTGPTQYSVVYETELEAELSPFPVR